MAKKVFLQSLLGLSLLVVVACGGGGTSSSVGTIAQGTTETNNAIAAIQTSGSVNLNSFDTAVNQFASAYNANPDDPQAAAGYAMTLLAQQSLAAYGSISGGSSVPVGTSAIGLSGAVLSVNPIFFDFKKQHNYGAAAIETTTTLPLSRDATTTTLTPAQLSSAISTLRTFNASLHTIIAGPLRDSIITNADAHPLTLTNPGKGGGSVKFGTAELYAFRAAAKGLAAALDVVTAYDYTVQDSFLASNPQTAVAGISDGVAFNATTLLPPSPFLERVSDPGTEVTSFISTGADDVAAANTAFTSRTTTGFLLDVVGISPVDAMAAVNQAAVGKAWVTGTQSVDVRINGSTVTLNFSAGTFLNSLPTNLKALLPKVKLSSGQLIADSYPDPTFGGLVTNGGTTLNGPINSTVSANFSTFTTFRSLYGL